MSFTGNTETKRCVLRMVVKVGLFQCVLKLVCHSEERRARRDYVPIAMRSAGATLLCKTAQLKGLKHMLVLKLIPGESRNNISFAFAIDLLFRICEGRNIVAY